MATPAMSANFADLLDPRMAKIFDEREKQLPDRLSDFYTFVSQSDAPTTADYRVSEVSGFGDVPEFTGSVTYDDVSQGYDRTFTHKEYASGFQVTRKLFDDAMFGVIDGKPRNLALAWNRTRQKHGASTFNNAFSIDTTWLNNTESVALCSDSHTTTTGASTTTGFDNKLTTAFSATALVAARIQFRQFRDARANRISANPDLILHPINLYDAVYEVTQSTGKPGVSTNDANVHSGAYKTMDWEYLTDTNDWYLIDGDLMKEELLWIDRVPKEFGMVEDFDSFVGKWRLYGRYSLGHVGWRWILGSQVS